MRIVSDKQDWSRTFVSPSGPWPWGKREKSTLIDHVQVRDYRDRVVNMSNVLRSFCSQPFREALFTEKAFLSSRKHSCQCEYWGKKHLELLLLLSHCTALLKGNRMAVRGEGAMPHFSSHQIQSFFATITQSLPVQLGKWKEGLGPRPN